MIGTDPRPGESAIRLTRETHAILLPALREVARQHGYALAVHGSLERDIDLIAAPWSEEATQPVSLATALFRVCEAVMTAAWPASATQDAPGSLLHPVRKPHGRLGWVIHLPGTYIDLSVMPPLVPPPKGKRRP